MVSDPAKTVSVDLLVAVSFLQHLMVLVVPVDEQNRDLALFRRSFHSIEIVSPAERVLPVPKITQLHQRLASVSCRRRNGVLHEMLIPM
jgi:hypothetical protein